MNSPNKSMDARQPNEFAQQAKEFTQQSNGRTIRVRMPNKQGNSLSNQMDVQQTIERPTNKENNPLMVSPSQQKKMVHGHSNTSTRQ
jgi:hypothetical protein